MRSKADVTLSAAHRKIYIHKVENSCLFQLSVLLQQYITIIVIKNTVAKDKSTKGLVF